MPYTYDRIVLGVIGIIIGGLIVFQSIHRIVLRHKFLSVDNAIHLFCLLWVVLRIAWFFIPDVSASNEVGTCAMAFLFYVPLSPQFTVFSLMLLYFAQTFSPHQHWDRPCLVCRLLEKARRVFSSKKTPTGTSGTSDTSGSSPSSNRTRRSSRDPHTHPSRVLFPTSTSTRPEEDTLSSSYQHYGWDPMRISRWRWGWAGSSSTSSATTTTTTGQIGGEYGTVEDDGFGGDSSFFSLTDRHRDPERDEAKSILDDALRFGADTQHPSSSSLLGSTDSSFDSSTSKKTSSTFSSDSACCTQGCYLISHFLGFNFFWLFFIFARCGFQCWVSVSDDNTSSQSELIYYMTIIFTILTSLVFFILMVVLFIYGLRLSVRIKLGAIPASLRGPYISVPAVLFVILLCTACFAIRSVFDIILIAKADITLFFSVDHLREVAYGRPILILQFLVFEIMPIVAILVFFWKIMSVRTVVPVPLLPSRHDSSVNALQDEMARREGEIPENESTTTTGGEDEWEWVTETASEEDDEFFGLTPTSLSKKRRSSSRTTKPKPNTRSSSSRQTRSTNTGGSSGSGSGSGSGDDDYDKKSSSPVLPSVTSRDEFPAFREFHQVPTLDSSTTNLEFEEKVYHSSSSSSSTPNKSNSRTISGLDIEPIGSIGIDDVDVDDDGIGRSGNGVAPRSKSPFAAVAEEHRRKRSNLLLQKSSSSPYPLLRQANQDPDDEKRVEEEEEEVSNDVVNKKRKRRRRRRRRRRKKKKKKKKKRRSSSSASSPDLSRRKRHADFSSSSSSDNDSDSDGALAPSTFESMSRYAGLFGGKRGITPLIHSSGTTSGQRQLSTSVNSSTKSAIVHSGPGLSHRFSTSNSGIASPSPPLSRSFGLVHKTPLMNPYHNPSVSADSMKKLGGGGTPPTVSASLLAGRVPKGLQTPPREPHSSPPGAASSSSVSAPVSPLKNKKRVREEGRVRMMRMRMMLDEEEEDDEEISDEEDSEEEEEEDRKRMAEDERSDEDGLFDQFDPLAAAAERRKRRAEEARRFLQSQRGQGQGQGGHEVRRQEREVVPSAELEGMLGIGEFNSAGRVNRAEAFTRRPDSEGEDADDEGEDDDDDSDDEEEEDSGDLKAMLGYGMFNAAGRHARVAEATRGRTHQGRPKTVAVDDVMLRKHFHEVDEDDVSEEGDYEDGDSEEGEYYDDDDSSGEYGS